MKEQHNLIKVLLHYKPKNLDNELKVIMNFKMVRLLLKLMKSYLSPD